MTICQGFGGIACANLALYPGRGGTEPMRCWRCARRDDVATASAKEREEAAYMPASPRGAGPIQAVPLLVFAAIRLEGVPTTSAAVARRQGWWYQDVHAVVLALQAHGWLDRGLPVHRATSGRIEARALPRSTTPGAGFYPLWLRRVGAHGRNKGDDVDVVAAFASLGFDPADRPRVHALPTSSRSAAPPPLPPSTATPTMQAEALARWLVERASVDPVGTALGLATVEQLEAELARRRALVADPLYAAGLPPAE